MTGGFTAGGISHDHTTNMDIQTPQNGAEDGTGNTPARGSPEIQNSRESTGPGPTPQKVFQQKQKDGNEEISGIMHISDQQEKEASQKKIVDDAADNSLVVDSEITQTDIKVSENANAVVPPLA